ncbi:hypothetical protein MSG28_000539 [Choristoneura fumiferana]|uniref:Uncharacterized protein n=1 Tax=Choristoneura fumiferana TaxID=7141 RepID=A0ACC0K1F6_CHOFU|nr:hypothetical protein MSG28_000539 [Choristoneura fumiferana]
MVSPRFHTGITVKPMGPMASTNPSEHPRSNFKSTNETMFVKINVKMTSEGEADKTTEFVRRRKLRLQQVREQSKDIAKLIRQRAKIEKLRQVVELDANQEKDYLQRQEKVVKKLEELYSKGLQNFGTSHKDASGLKQPEKTDLSRLRGKEAAAELKRSKQQKLDEQKKTLDRKIQAREAANIISREKSTTAASKLSTKSSTNKLSEVSKSDGKIETAHKSSSEISGDNAGDKVVTRNDMGTQWDTEILPLEWEPNIPALPIPKDDSNKESMCIDTENNTEKKKRPNLFALSDEMPSSLRGSCYPIIINEPAKPSLTLVSEYIQNRALRLRETPVSNSNKKNSADLQNLKQTILRTRSLRAEGSAFSNICHVLEGQVIPVPTWHAEPSCQHHSPNILHHKQNFIQRRQPVNVTNSQIKFFDSRPELARSPVTRQTRPLSNKFSAYQNRSGDQKFKLCVKLVNLFKFIFHHR